MTENPADEEPSAASQTITERVTADCRADDGPCQASTECTGTVEGRDCDVGAMIAPEAAACVAFYEGLDEGLSGFSVFLVYEVGHRRIVWVVQNLLEDLGPDGASGVSMDVDALTGEVLASASWAAVP